MKDFEYAKNKKNNGKKWYIIRGKKYNYYIWALPLIPFVVAHDKIEDWAYNRREWNEATACKVLDHALPYILEWVEEDNAFYYCMEWGHSNLWRKAPLHLRKWAMKFEYRLHEFIKESYQKDGYSKSVESDYYETWVKFQKEI